MLGKGALGGIEAPVSEQDLPQGAASRRAQRRSQGEVVEEAEEAKGGEGGEVEVRPATEIRDRNQRVREQAAQKRDASRQTKSRSSKATGLGTTEMVDDALTRSTHAAIGFTKKHFNVLQWVVLGGIATAVGTHLYSHRRDGQLEAASDVMANALRVENGRIGDTGERGPDKMTGLADVQPSFGTEAERGKAMSRAYELAKAQAANQGAAVLAEMGQAAAAFNAHKWSEAARLYANVKASDIAAEDTDLKARALLGISQAKEGLADREGALKPLRELENMGVSRFVPVAQYHQARMLYAKGQAEKAKPLLEKALKKLEADKPSADAYAPPSELESSVRALLTLIDPTQAQAPSSGGMTPEQMARFRAQIDALGKNSRGPNPGKSAPTP